MEEIRKKIWEQLGAAIDMLRNAIKECPETLWDNGSLYWYMAYHTLFFLDYYMDSDPNSFHPRAPFTMSEMDPTGLMPDRTYTQAELVEYLDECREKCKERTLSMTDATMFSTVSTYGGRTYPLLEVLLFNTRHVQHHTAQLNLLLRQNGVVPPKWVARADMSI